MHGASKEVAEIGVLARIGFAFIVNCRWCDPRQQTGAPGTRGTGNQPGWLASPGDRSSPDGVVTTCLGWREVTGFFHAKRRKDIPLNVNVFGLAGEFLDQRPEHDV